MKKLIAAILIALTLSIWMLRYEIYPVNHKPIAAYKLDRFTGKLTALSVLHEIRVGSIEERDKEPESVFKHKPK